MQSHLFITSQLLSLGKLPVLTALNENTGQNFAVCITAFACVEGKLLFPHGFKGLSRHHVVWRTVWQSCAAGVYAGRSHGKKCVCWF